MALDEKNYLDIIKKTTLTAIDLVIIHDNKILMGYRNNNQASNCWFVPGCRTRKNETQSQGAQRVAKTELGINIDLSKLNGASICSNISKAVTHSKSSFNTIS